MPEQALCCVYTPRFGNSCKDNLLDFHVTTIHVRVHVHVHVSKTHVYMYMYM